MLNRNLPVGTRDEFGATAQIKERMINQIQRYFRERGYAKITTPLLEYKAVFSELDLKTYQPYQLLDEQGETLVLRPDLTLPVARVMSTTGIKTPVKWYYSGDVFRVKKKLSGSYNQIAQAGIELIGYKSLKAEWECLVAAVELAQALQITDLKVELGNAKFVPLVLAALPLNEIERRNLQTALYAKDLSRYTTLIKPLATSDFYPFLKVWPWLFGDFATVWQQLQLLPKIKAVTAICEELKETQIFLQQRFPQQQLTLDLSIASPQTYYTGMIFRGYCQSAADYLFSGGRYDQLLSSFQKTLQPAVGLAFSIDDLVARTITGKPVETTLIYFKTSDWRQAEALVRKIPNSSLCLADNLKEARRLAETAGSRLVDVTGKVVQA
ncbi:ATP phosphoribosyltransferase regulatory subunit [Loigolactobacillus iwatensis]|uniref:ATP phosphoribosyltransferase regulatory subunit n=1 Tax=Loigolactobacillus iwatensis TaxID=1267156 RepID=UPI000F7F88FE|nr:ATP phosphoribosyltransferase regulatory subunit [Loigolactobacillus iwatensis]